MVVETTTTPLHVIIIFFIIIIEFFIVISLFDRYFELNRFQFRFKFKLAYMLTWMDLRCVGGGNFRNKKLYE